MIHLLLIVVLAGIGYAAIEKVAKAMGQRGASDSELAQLKERLDDTQATVAGQATQLAELQERVDFAERTLAQVRNRPALGAGQEKQE